MPCPSKPLKSYWRSLMSLPEGYSKGTEWLPWMAANTTSACRYACNPGTVGSSCESCQEWSISKGERLLTRATWDYPSPGDDRCSYSCDQGSLAPNCSTCSAWSISEREALPSHAKWNFLQRGAQYEDGCVANCSLSGRELVDEVRQC